MTFACVPATCIICNLPEAKPILNTYSALSIYFWTYILNTTSVWPNFPVVHLVAYQAAEYLYNRVIDCFTPHAIELPLSSFDPVWTFKSLVVCGLCHLTAGVCTFQSINRKSVCLNQVASLYHLQRGFPIHSLFVIGAELLEHAIS